MNKIYFYITVFFVIGYANVGTSQSKMVGICGCTAEEQEQIKLRMLENRETFKNQTILRPESITYIPITYHLVAKSDGTGRIALRRVFENLCAINKIYATQNLGFYLKEVKSPNNTSVYENPTGALGAQTIKNWRTQNPNSVNIFCASIANPAEPGVLAFYNPNGDYIVTENNQVSSNGTTLAHELGHFFSLAHTFFGWEGNTYNCSLPTPTVTPSGVLVEYVSRTKMFNNQLLCKVAADGFCDTQADYNLGFGWPSSAGCVYSGCAKDPDNVPLDPDEKNIMSYFLSCLEYFSEEQKEAILLDYLSSKRSSLRTISYTTKHDLTGTLNYLTPSKNQTVSGYNSVLLSWEPMPNAESYLLEIAENSALTLNSRAFLLKRTDTTFTDLKKNTNYYWRVYPMNQNSFCSSGATINFRTPSFGVAIQETAAEKLKISFLTSSNNAAQLYLQSSSTGHAKLIIQNIVGATLKNSNVDLDLKNQIIDIENCVPGVYTYSIQQENEVLKIGKLIIQ